MLLTNKRPQCSINNDPLSTLYAYLCFTKGQPQSTPQPETPYTITALHFQNIFMKYDAIPHLNHRAPHIATILKTLVAKLCDLKHLIESLSTSHHVVEASLTLKEVSNLIDIVMKAS